MKKNYHLYLGRAGHLVLMSEFLIRGWNVVIPEIDIGDDIFVVQDEDGILRRVQVKTSTATVKHKGFSGRFQISLRQLTNVSNIFLHYAFIVRHSNQWTKPIIIRQDALLNHFETDKIGSVHGEVLNLYFAYFDEKVICSNIDLTSYIADFSDFPIIE
jgi:hypothetical protein